MPEQLLDYETFSRLRGELSNYANGRVKLSPNARREIFGKVYLKDNERGEKETIEDRMAAISLDIASAELRYLSPDMGQEERLRRVMDYARTNLDMYLSNTFRANTPVNINFGRWEVTYDDEGNTTGYRMQDQLGSACFVIPIEDTFGKDILNLEDGLLEAWNVQQLVHKHGGGTGFSFQRIRPKGSIIRYNPAIHGMKSFSWDGRTGVASGYENFMNNFYNAATDAVKQGNTRRGANMGIQRIDHMDFLDHLFAKFGLKGDEHRSEYRMKNFNLSLAVTDEFMEAAAEDRTYTLYDPHRAKPEIRKVLEKKFGVEHPELVRKDDLATKAQFVEILRRNATNSKNPLTTPNMYLGEDGTSVINAYDGEQIGTIVDGIVRIYAKRVLNLITKLSHSNGEPGVFFVDRANEYNPIRDDQEYEATNPCGEQPLPANGACDLGSINVGKFVRHSVFDSEMEARHADIPKDKWVSINKRNDGRYVASWFDWAGLRTTIRNGTRYLDDLIDRNDVPAPKIRKAIENGRNIGLGYMGVADAMMLLGVRYGSENSFELAKDLGRVLDEESLAESQKLAEERGEFPLWERSLHNPDSRLFKEYSERARTIPDRFRGQRKISDKVNRTRVIKYGGGKVRNSCRTTQAPTGTISRSSGESDAESGLENLAISGGIEPVFSFRISSNILNSKVDDVSYGLVKLLEKEDLPVKEIVEAIGQNRGSAHIYSYTSPEVSRVLGQIPERVRDALVTAAGGENGRYEITPEQHVDMQNAFQEYTDSAISKTINFPSSATPKDVDSVWFRLWAGGSKGGTIYVDKSREFQILNVVDSDVPAVQKVNGKNTRPLLQRSFTIELPYNTSVQKDGTGELDFNPDRCFTTVAYNLVNGHVTGIFQNIPEVDPERTSAIADRNIERSRALKNGRRLDDVIADLEKIRFESGKRGVVDDEAVMNGNGDRMRYRVEGATTTEDELKSLYIIRFLVGDGSLNPQEIEERVRKYEMGEISLRSIINTRGKIKIEEENGKNPSLLGSKKSIKLPEGVSEKLCPECG